MSAKHTLATLGTLLLASLPIVSRAETQTQWLLDQLQYSDGNPGPGATAMPMKEKAAKESLSAGTDLKENHEKPKDNHDKPADARGKYTGAAS